ncbi:MAG: FAD-dependent oxidoreductase [Actinobacteria bacterium]|nr:FAD-dependent oxidoreductase [Actinomycetota bacterium]
MTDGYRSLSLWHDTVPGPLEPRSALPGDRDTDVAIIGAGYTGLWTAYHLALLDPSLRIMVLEREIAGFGASGRNGGWALGEYGISPMAFAAASSTDAALRQTRALYDAVDAIGRVAGDEGIDCHYAKGGWIDWARNPAHLERAKASVAARHELGLTEDEVRVLGPDEARTIGNASGVLGGRFLSAVAAIHPARLVRGLADACERRGVVIHEGTACTGFEQGVVRTDRGAVRAEVVVRATEGYTRDLAGHRRTMAPIYSLMIATAPLPDAVWDEIGLHDRPTFKDTRHLTIYGQRTADGRFAFGGRGAPYRFGSRIDPATEQAGSVHDELVATLRDLFPVIGDVEITHRWGGVLGAPRDWFPAVCLDRSTGLATAGGYVGDGVAASKLAGHTLADLIVGVESERTDLPWVGHVSPKWEPEPLRWLGVNAGLMVAAAADRAEARRGRITWHSSVLKRLTG